MKRSFYFLSIAGLCLSFVSPAQAASWAPPTVGPGEYGFNIEEAENWDTISRLTAVKYVPGKNQGDEYNCLGFGAAPCNFSEDGYSAGESSLIASRCDTFEEINCISSLAFSVSGSEKVSAKFVEYIKGPTISADPARGLTEGSTISLWEAPNAPHEGGNRYAVKLTLGLSWDKVKSKFFVWRVDASITPYSLKLGPYQNIEVSTGDYAGRQQIRIQNKYPACAWNDEGRCGVFANFAPGIRAELAFKVANTAGGWFKGRLKDPNIEILTAPNDSNLIRVEAEPVTVPRFSVTFPESAIDADVEKLFSETFRIRPSLGSSTATRSEFDLAFRYLEIFRALAKDKSAGTSTIWNFGTTVGVNLGSKCLSDTTKLLGLITTNATVFMAGPPKFDQGFLTYKVAGLHYMPDGVTEVAGTYDLIIRSEAARCLYKFSKAPVSATVTVTGGNSQNIATTVVSEKNGWLKLAAYGFTFSTKNIKIKLTQKKSSVVCVSKTNTKSLKTVQVGQKCPAGFKVKS